MQDLFWWEKIIYIIGIIFLTITVIGLIALVFFVGFIFFGGNPWIVAIEIFCLIGIFCCAYMGEKGW